MDDIDINVLQQLMTHGRITWSELASLLQLSAPATADRVRRLEEKGIIQSYAALVNPELIGCGITAFIAVTLDRPEHRQGFVDLVNQLPEIQECHHVTGDDDYLLKVRCTSTRSLEALISNQIKGLPGILRTRTTLALSTVKETPVLPLPI